MDLARSCVDIEKYGLVMPHLPNEVESKLKRISEDILMKRKPQYYWKILYAHPLALKQLTEYARIYNDDMQLTPSQQTIYATQLTQQQVVHIGNGGIIDAVPQSEFRLIRKGTFDRKKFHGPVHYLAHKGLIKIYPNDVKERHGSQLRIATTNKGIWVFDHLSKILTKIDKMNPIDTEIKNIIGLENIAREGPSSPQKI